MVKVSFNEHFENTVRRIKEASVKKQIQKLILKISNYPEIGKPMRHDRKGTRELYLPSFRLSYVFIKEREEGVILDFYHKDYQ